MKQGLNHDWLRGPLGLLLILTILNIFASWDLISRIPWPLPEKSKSLNHEVYVEIKGDIDKPGLYCFQRPPTLFEALGQANVPQQFIEKWGASENYILKTGVTISVKFSDQGTMNLRFSSMNAFWRVTLGIPICLNKESPKGLTALPGIGEKMANAIVETRKRLGGFTSLEQLGLVPGIGPKLMDKISPYLTLCSDPEYEAIL